MQNVKKVQNSVKTLRSFLPPDFSPRVGLVLGTGLGEVAALFESSIAVPYASLLDFPQSTVTSHAGQFIAGEWHGVPVIAQQGRCHLYEGKSPDEVCMGVRVMADLGIETLILTNAAGALNPYFTVGGLMIIEDQINMTAQSPLTGNNHNEWGDRFPDMSQLYDQKHIQSMEQCALRLGMRLEKGVYAGVTGPQMETKAETRMLRYLGADAVGMSTVLEAIAARHRGLRLIGLSSITNKNLPDTMEPAPLDTVIAMAAIAQKHLATLLKAALPTLITPGS